MYFKIIDENTLLWSAIFTIFSKIFSKKVEMFQIIHTGSVCPPPQTRKVYIDYIYI